MILPITFYSSSVNKLKEVTTVNFEIPYSVMNEEHPNLAYHWTGATTIEDCAQDHKGLHKKIDLLTHQREFLQVNEVRDGNIILHSITKSGNNMASVHIEFSEEFLEENAFLEIVDSDDPSLVYMLLNNLAHTALDELIEAIDIEEE